PTCGHLASPTLFPYPTLFRSGLQYEVLNAGEEGAESPTLEDTVEVHYQGSLVDGTVFDSSIERDKPAVFGLKHIIPGWQEALPIDRKSTRLNSSHVSISYAVF